MKVLDLFSGIGAFSLGLERAGMETIAFCEIEPYCRAVLRKHWPNVPIYEDVKAITEARLRADGIIPDVVCGGFPCQDISIAGKHGEFKEDRSGLWKEFIRVLSEVRPRYAVMENSPLIISRGLEEILTAFAEIRFNAEWGIIRAADVGACHIRSRWWLVAYPEELGQSRRRCVWPAEQKEFERLGSRELWERRSESRPVGVVDGIPYWSHRIGALGNTAIPQIVEIVGRGIMENECSCPKECDCDDPEPAFGTKLISMICPVHNDNPDADYLCPVHGHNALPPITG